MIELGSVGKIKRAMRLAKLAQVGMSLTYFDVIELLGELEGLEETVRILDTRDDDALVTAYRTDNAELRSQLAAEKEKNDHMLGCLFEYETVAPNGNLGVSLLNMDNHIRSLEADNAELKRKLEMAEQYVANNTVLLARALKAEALIKSLIAVGNIILNQDGKLDEDIKLAEAVWRVLVRQANE